MIATTSTSNVTSDDTRRYASGITNGWRESCSPAWVEFSAPARVPERGSTLQRASCCVMPRRATTSSPASLASPGRPVPPSIMPSRTNLQPGTCINHRAGPVFVWCGRISNSAAHDNGPLRCASRGGSLVTWDGRGHFTRPGIFYSGRPCWTVRQSFLGPWRPWRLEILNACLLPD